MKHCINCGNSEKDDANFCHICGYQLQDYKVDPSQTSPQASPFIKQKKKRNILVSIFLWLFFWPIMIILLIAKTSRFTKPIKISLIAIFIVFMSVIILSTPEESNSTIGDDSVNSTISDTDSFSDSSNNLFSDIIFDESLRTNFLMACEQIGMDPRQIKNLEQVDNWVSGPRYSFTYQNAGFRLYCNMDSTVAAIKLGADTDIYKQGFEPYQVSDYIVDPSIAAELQVISEDHVKSQLNYPSTADFSWLNWGFGRDHDLYSVSSTVKAENAFGVEDELPFTITYQVTDGQAKLLLFVLDGNTIVNHMDAISIPERKELPSSSSNSSSSAENAITLVEGELGSYGKAIDIDGFTTINYHVPEGTYTVSNNGILCTLYLAKDEYYRNSDGYMENEIVETLSFSEHGETKTITIGSGEHLELTINASVTLTPIE